MNNFYTLTHNSGVYNISLDLLENRKKDAADAYFHIDTDQIMLRENKRVLDYKQDYKEYKNQGGKEKTKQFLDRVAERDFGVKWDALINHAKETMISAFGVNRNWITSEDHITLISLADSGHAQAAYVLGRQLMKQDSARAVEWLVKCHNFGHVGGLFALSGYLAKKGNTIGAIACMVISADKGNDMAPLSICHTEMMAYMQKADTDDLVKTLELLAEKTPYSTARYLLLTLRMFAKNDIALLDDIIAQPQNPPKDKDMDEEYTNRDNLLKGYFTKIRERILDSQGKIVALEKRLDIMKLVSAEYPFIAFNDFMELDEAIQQHFSS